MDPHLTLHFYLLLTIFSYQQVTIFFSMYMKYKISDNSVREMLTNTQRAFISKPF